MNQDIDNMNEDEYIQQSMEYYSNLTEIVKNEIFQKQYQASAICINIE